MQKIVLFLWVVFFSNQSLCMYVFKDLNESSAHKKTKHDDSQDLMPPECFRTVVPQELVPKGTSISRVPSFDLSFSDSSLVWPDLEKEYDDPFDDCVFSLPPALPHLYYLVVYDNNTRTERIFSADSKSDLLKNFLICYINHANTEISRQAQTHLHAKARSLPVTMQKNEYRIICNAGGGLCQNIEVAPSQEILMVQLFAHFVAEHQKNSEWHKKVSTHIAGSIDQARAKLQAK